MGKIMKVIGVMGIMGMSSCHMGNMSKGMEVVKLEERGTVALVGVDYRKYDMRQPEHIAYCSGVWVDEGHILTAGHCVEGELERLKDHAEKIKENKPKCEGLGLALGLCEEEEDKGVELELEGMEVRYITSQESEGVGVEPSGEHIGRVISIDKGKDLALIAARGHAIPLHYSARVGERGKIGEKVYGCGHPGGVYFTYMEGSISGYQSRINGREMMLVQIPITFGNSGGPLFNEEGELIGIADLIMRGLGGEGFYLPADTIQSFLKDNEVKNGE